MGWTRCFGSLMAAVIACAAASSFAQGTGSTSAGGDVISRLHECERHKDPAAKEKCIDDVVPGPSRAMPQSTCSGAVNNGRVENAVSLPREGANFVRMAQGPVSAGRVFVHSLVHDILLDAYRSLAEERPRPPAGRCEEQGQRPGAGGLPK